MLLHYFYFKNFVYTSIQLLFAFENCFSMQSIFPEAYLTLFNMINTQFPIFFFSIFEQDVNVIEERDGTKLKPYIPSLYFVGQRMLHFNSFVAGLWFSVGFFQIFVIFFVHK